MKERSVLKCLLSIMCGTIEPTPENAEAFAHDRRIAVTFMTRRRNDRVEKRGRTHKKTYANLLDMDLDDLACKLRRLRGGQEDSDDGRWLRAMVHCWVVALDGVGENIDGLALHFANLAGEADYFRRHIAPAIQSRFAA
jgi:hypothetical protein